MKSYIQQILKKAAALAESLINNHPFIDGNKRTGIAVMVLFLEINDTVLKASNQDIVDLGLAIAKSELKIGQIVSWLRLHNK